MKRLVFVYGTLRRGGRLHSYMKTAEFIEAGTTPGRLFSLGSFPGAHFGSTYPGSSGIHGEVYAVDKTTLDKLDSLEGYHENRPEISMYVRCKVPVTTAAHAVDYMVWAYQYRGEARHIITSGDWIKYDAPARRES